MPQALIASPTPTQPRPAHSHDPSMPSVVVSANTLVSSGSMPSTSSVSPHSRPHNVPPQYLSADWLPQTAPPDPPPSLAKSPPTAYSPAKGHTLFEQLKEHSVTWEQTLDVMVQMGIGRETNELGGCEAKFVVMQMRFPLNFCWGCFAMGYPRRSGCTVNFPARRSEPKSGSIRGCWSRHSPVFA
ncbi:hypothetical protein EDB19DRAFT_2041261 [Suillus lakei]|nr:hypothetical protein EDB19DRAFT_2041261 [Suillus lakei]